MINESSSAFGDGWTLDGLEQITSASGGVILNVGGGGDSLWFAGSFGSGGGTYTNPAGDFSTLVLNSNGSYTRHPADRRPDHIQLGRLRDGDHRLERPAHHLRLYEQPADIDHRSLFQRHVVDLQRRQPAPDDPGPGAAG